jgi:hypothetical protein
VTSRSTSAVMREWLEQQLGGGVGVVSY